MERISIKEGIAAKSTALAEKEGSLIENDHDIEPQDR